MYLAAVIFFIFMSSHLLAQNQFAWVSTSNDVADESQTYLFPNIGEIFTRVNTWEQVQCDASEHTMTSNALSEKHYKKGEYKGNGAFIWQKGEYLLGEF